jgi:hypothetical protein
MRDHAWLQNQLEFLLSKYFANVPINNPVEVHWGREARYRFGSIKLVKPRGLRTFLGFRSRKKILENHPQKSLINITGMFKDESIPVGVVHYTVAHELCHYAHGFSSTNKKLFRFPHHGGVINKELTERGAQELIPVFKRWLKEYRKGILEGRRSVGR